MARAAGPRAPGEAAAARGPRARWQTTSLAVTAAATDGTGGAAPTTARARTWKPPPSTPRRPCIPRRRCRPPTPRHRRPTLSPRRPTFGTVGGTLQLPRQELHAGRQRHVRRQLHQGERDGGAGQLAAGADCSAAPAIGSSQRMARHARHPGSTRPRRLIVGVGFFCP
jgi:hypothetical protein